jgi:Skp family chaperone for outer membrane proteins
MKTLFTIGLTAMLTSVATAAELRICTIDLQRAMGDYYKTEEATRQLKLRDVSYLKELEPLRLEGTKLERETRELALLARDNALSSTAREEKKRLFEQKQIDLSELQVRYDDLQAKRQTDLQKLSLQTRKQIVDEVVKVTRRIGETEGFNLILNANQTEPIASEVLFTRNVDDITDRVLASLNAGRPPAAPVDPKADPGK